MVYTNAKAWSSISLFKKCVKICCNTFIQLQYEGSYLDWRKVVKRAWLFAQYWSFAPSSHFMRLKTTNNASSKESDMFFCSKRNRKVCIQGRHWHGLK